MSQKLVCDACNKHIEPYQTHYHVELPSIEYVPNYAGHSITYLPKIEGDYCSARCLHIVVTKAIDSAE